LSDPVIEKGIERLAYQFLDSEKFKGFLTSFLTEYEELNTSGLQLLNERYLDIAVGAQLDGIGEIVGLPRPEGETDTLYRFLIRIRIIKNKTAMTIDDTLRLISFTFENATVRYFQTSFLEPRYDIEKHLEPSEEVLVPNFPILIGLETVTYHSYSKTTSFGFYGDPDALGFGDLNDSDIGGNFAKIIT